MTETTVPTVTNLKEKKSHAKVKAYAKITLGALVASAAVFGVGYAYGKGISHLNVSVPTVTVE